MRAFSYSRLPLAAAMLIAVTIAHRGDGQTKPPALKATLDLRIDSALTSPTRAAFILPGASGDVVVAPIESQGTLRWFDATGHALPFKSPIAYARDGDLRWLSRIAWTGSTLIAIDPGFRQIAEVDRKGKVTKSVEFPSFVHPSWSDRHKYPVFARYDALAMYPNGDWLVRPLEPKTLMSTPSYDSTYTYFMRTNENGVIQRVFGRVPRNESILERRALNGRWSYRAPFAARTLWDVSADGSRIVIVSQAVKGPDSASYRVTVFGDKGDTVWSKKFVASLTPIPKKSVDSALARIDRGFREQSASEMRTLVAKEIPPVFPPIENILIGADKTIWLELHSSSADRQWLALDEAGAPVSVASVPRTFVARAADRTHLWGFEADGDQLRTLVRYSIASSPVTAKR